MIAVLDQQKRRQFSQIKTIFEEGWDGGGGGPRFRYLYVVWNSYHDAVRAEVDRQKKAFAEDLGAAGVWQEPFEAERAKLLDTFRAKRWPDEVIARIDDDGEPLILVTTDDSGGFTMFDPRGYKWAIIWLSDFKGALDIKPLFQTLARKTKAGEDVIEYLREVAIRSRHKKKAGQIAQLFAHASGYVEWKPTIPLIGVGIDVKAILADIAAAAASNP